jgi:release factor glutamine methyltransferase
MSRESRVASRENRPPDSRLTTHDSRLTTHDSRLTTHDSRLTTHDSRLTTHDSRLADAAHRLEAAGVERPVFEAQLLLVLALGVTRLDVLRGPIRKVTEEEARRFEALVEERVRRIPLAYLRGTQEFYSLDFEVTPAVLVPRPETELLVEFAVEKLRSLTTPDSRLPTLIDVGTGSGCIAVAAAVHLPAARVVALDLSSEALATALRNAKRHNVEERVRFVRTDLLSGIVSQSAEMILSNPPYIPSAEVPGLPPEVRDFEPRVAVDGGADGFAFHRGLIAGARRVLKPGGWLGLEVALGQASLVAVRLVEAGFTDVETRKDLAGIERMVAGRQPEIG